MPLMQNARSIYAACVNCFASYINLADRSWLMAHGPWLMAHASWLNNSFADFSTKGQSVTLRIVFLETGRGGENVIRSH